MNSSYPYGRSEECSWQPEELARHLASLAGREGSHHHEHLLSRGWSSRHVASLRARFGSNVMHGDDDCSHDHKPWWGRLSPCLPPILHALAGQLKEPLILMLLSSAAISVVLGNSADAVSIGIALLIVSLVAAVQEYRSEAALEKLAHLVPHTCTVLRDGKVLDGFFAQQLVVGDLVLLATGDRVPADCRVVDSVELLLDESSLTGENHPVAKTGEGLTLSAAPTLTQQGNVVFCGTLVTAGRGRALVVATGKHTEFGKVATELNSVTSRKSPLQVKIDELGKRLAAFSSLAIASIALLGWLMGRPFLETVTVAVSLAVAAIPEGLPICVTVTLALGVLRMARLNAIVKKLPAVESLGCATVVASDKTGTLTQNEMTARSLYVLAYPKTVFGFTGVGYDSSNGELVKAEDPYELKSATTTRPVTPNCPEFGAMSALFHVVSLCNNATVVSSVDDSIEGRTGGTLSGQPTELALLVASEKAGVPDPRPLYHRVQEVPFTSDRKRMEVRARPVSGTHPSDAFVCASKLDAAKSLQAPLSPRARWHAAAPSGTSAHTPHHHAHDGCLYFVKGMPESVLGESISYTAPDGSSAELTEDMRTRVLNQSRRMAAMGLRVLAAAYGPSLDNMTFAGLLGVEDPPREGVVDAVKQLRRGGVKVLMVTGDSKETALAIAGRCGILGSEHDDQNDSRSPSSSNAMLLHHQLSSSELGLEDVEFGASLALSGEELDSIPPDNLAESIVGVRVFYRVVPRHKLALVRALQQQDEIVAMTGDGVNDATALKGADIGIAMGKGGTDVAKEAADVVLADDDFSTITKAVAEGKGIFFNIRNFLSFQLSTSFAALTMNAFATACGLPSPLNAMQILWINIIMDGPPAQSLGVEPVDDRILKAKPRKADDPIVTQALLARAVTSAALIVYITLKVFSNELDDGQITRRDTTMTFMTFVNCDLFNAYVCRSSERCFFELSPFSNPAFLWAVGGSVLGQLMVIYFPPLQEVFQTEALHPHDLLYIIFLSSSVLWLDTLRKKFFGSSCSDAFHPSPRAKKEDDEDYDTIRMPRTKSWLNFRKTNREKKKRRKTRKRSILAL